MDFINRNGLAWQIVRIYSRQSQPLILIKISNLCLDAETQPASAVAQNLQE